MSVTRHCGHMNQPKWGFDHNIHDQYDRGNMCRDEPRLGNCLESTEFGDERFKTAAAE